MDIYVIRYNAGMYDTYREWLSRKAYRTKQAANDVLIEAGYMWDGRMYAYETDDIYDMYEGLILAEIDKVVLED